MVQSLCGFSLMAPSLSTLRTLKCVVRCPMKANFIIHGWIKGRPEF